MLNQSIVSSIRQCKDDSPLFGAACTSLCGYHDTCNIKRQPLLIFSNNMKGRLNVSPDKNVFVFRKFLVWHSGHSDELKVQPDSEINGMFDDDEV